MGILVYKSPSIRIPTLPLLAEDHADEDDAHGQQKEQQNQCRSRALAESQVLEGDAIDCNRHHLRGLGRASLGHNEDQREVVDHLFAF